MSKCTKLSFSLLQECINDICEKYINSYCSKKDLFFIFERIGLNSEWSKIHKQCNNIIEDRLENEEENELNIDNETKLIQFPPAWDSIFPMVFYVPVPMHSLFLGCFQSLLKLIKISLFPEIV